MTSNVDRIVPAWISRISLRLLNAMGVLSSYLLMMIAGALLLLCVIVLNHHREEPQTLKQWQNAALLKTGTAWIDARTVAGNTDVMGAVVISVTETISEDVTKILHLECMEDSERITRIIRSSSPSSTKISQVDTKIIGPTTQPNTMDGNCIALTQTQWTFHITEHTTNSFSTDVFHNIIDPTTGLGLPLDICGILWTAAKGKTISYSINSLIISLSFNVGTNSSCRYYSFESEPVGTRSTR